MTRILALIASLAAVPAFATDSSQPLTYEIFETAVAHADLDSCPAELARDGVFCRATLHHDDVHVFAFSEAGDSPLVGFSSYPFDSLAAALK
ncbi:hypothetical protein ACUXV3_03190 [Roseobacteraceae bacterium NS-SX3]